MTAAPAPLPRISLVVRGRRLLSVDTGGPGTPLVLVHGSPVSSWAFRHVIAALGTGRRIVAPDLPGFGGSEPAPGPLGFGGLAESLAAFFTQLSPGPAIDLAVHDWGGPAALGALALLAAAGRPLVLRRLMLVNTGFRPDFRPARWWPFQYRALGGLVERANLFSHGLRLLLGAARDPEVARVYRAALARPATRRLGARLEQLAGYREVCAKIVALPGLREVPTHVFHGEPEPYFGAGELPWFRRFFRRVTVERVAGAGHFPMEDAPGAFHASVARFFPLDGPSSPAPR